jgi:hypothetical protein
MRPRHNGRGNEPRDADQQHPRDASMRPRHNGRGNAAGGVAITPSAICFNEAPAQRPGKWRAGNTKKYTGLRTDSRGVPQPRSGVPDACWLGGVRVGPQPIHSQCQIAMRAPAARRTTQVRSQGGGGSSYTITGPRLTTVKGLLRLSTRGRMLVAGPRSRITTWSCAWSMISPSANLSSIRRRRLSRHWKTESCSHSAVPVHQPEDPAPAPRVADVVGYDVEVLIAAADAERPWVVGTVAAH